MTENPHPKVKCMLCGDECSSWWQYQAGLAREDRPMCYPCMVKTQDKMINGMVEVFKKNANK